MEAILSFIPVPVAVILMAAGFISLAVGGIRLGYKATVKDLALELVEKAELSIMGSGQGAKKKKQVFAALRAKCPAAIRWAITDEVLDGLDCADIPRLTVYNKCDKPGAMSFDPDILLTSAKTGYGLDTLLAKLDEVLSDRVHTLKVLLPYDKLGLAAPMRERGSVQVEEYREDGLYLEGIVKTEDLHCFEGYLV